MSDRAAAVEYLLPARGSMWAWVENGRNVAWTSDETIAFRQELLAIIARLAPGGLPPFAAIVLLLAATRDGWDVTSRKLLAHAQDICLPGGGDPASAAGVTLRAIGHRLEADTSALIAGLDRVAALPPEIRHRLDAKTVLSEMVFEKTDRRISPQIAEQVVTELRSGVDPATFDLGRPRIAAIRELVDSIDALKDGLQEVDADRLQLRLRTGLDRELAPADEDLGPAKRVHELLAELADDPELGGLSRIAHNLLAAVQVPRSLHRHEELPTGGVSDLSNRGQLDRLLISELAHDDLTLAVRVAVNEALYLQRESPPRDPPHRRVLLIDSGIRTWGVPRLYVTAVALALAATGDAEGELAAYRPEDSEVVGVDLATRDGLLSHLESLQPLPHFGAALPAFLEELAKSSEQSEPFLITQEDVLEDAEFRSALQKLDQFTGYAATVARDGTFRLWSLSAAGRSLLRQAKLDLEKLLSPPKPSQPRRPLPLVHPSAELPVILSTTPFPLLLSTNSQARRVTANSRGEKAAITTDRQLLLYSGQNTGARLLSDRMPIGRPQLFSFTDDNSAVVSAFTSVRRGAAVSCTLSVADIDGGLRPEVQLLGIDDPPLAILLRDETIFVICRKMALAYSPHSPQPLATLDTSEYRWLRGRLFAGPAPCVLALNGSKLTLEEIPKALPSAAIVELRGSNAPLIMTAEGELRTIEQTPQVVGPSLKENVIFEGVTDDGVAVVTRSRKINVRYYLKLGSDWHPTTASLKSVLDGTARYYLPGSTVFKRFSGVSVNQNGNLLLHRPGGGWVECRLLGPQLWLGYTRKEVGQPSPSQIHPFVHTASPRGTGYRLRVAAWAENSRAFLDSRGMLHLKSGDRSVPEITIVLNNCGPVAGWSSDGRVYGPKFFHGSDASYDPRHLAELLKQFTERLR